MKRLFLIAISLFFCSTSSLTAAELTILTEDLPPLNYLKNGALVGPSVEIVKEIQKRVGSDEQIEVYPWARAYKMALEKENVVLFSTTRSESRENLFKWVGPLATKRDVLVAKKGSGLKINTLEDAKMVGGIGTIRDDTKEELLKSLGFTNLESISDEQLNARKLFLGRIDLWAYKVPGIKTVCELAGVDYNELEIVYHLRKIDLGIAFSIQTPDSIVDKWRNAYDAMVADGTIMRIQSNWNVGVDIAPSGYDGRTILIPTEDP